MKMKFKAALSLMIVVMMVALSSVSAFAATYTYSTIYTKDSAGNLATKVTATASNVSVGEQVTYYAKNGDDVVYIDQEEAGSTKTVNFSYVTADASNLTQNFGGTSLATAQPVGDLTGEKISVTVNIKDADGTEKGTFTVEQAAQDENVTSEDMIARTFNIGNYTAITEVVYTPAEGVAVDVPMGSCVYLNGYLTVYPAVFTAGGVLDITVNVDEDQTPAIYTGDIFDESTETVKEYVALGRIVANGATGYEVGICVSSTSEFTNPTLFSVNPDAETLLFPATQFGADGSFAIGLISTDATHFAKDQYVAAYYKNGSTITFANAKQFSDGNWFTAE